MGPRTTSDGILSNAAHPYKNGNKYCDLCTTEKVEIILRSKDPRLLNSRSEIMAKCRHKREVFAMILVTLNDFSFFHFNILIINPLVFARRKKTGIFNNNFHLV